MNLADAGLTLRDVDLGGVDAESDVRLAEYFVDTPYSRSALSGRRTVFLGRKGSGKSALFTQLPRLADVDAKEEWSVLLITPDQYAWTALREYEEQGLTPDYASRNAWKLTLAVEILGALLGAERGWTLASGRALDKGQKFLSDNFGTIKPGLLRTATSIVTGLKSFNFSAFGVGGGWTRSDKTARPLTPAVAEELLRIAGAALWEHRLIVGIDRLDDAWDGSDRAKSLLVGLLMAAKELNEEHASDDPEAGLRIDVFLRSDIYDSLRFDEKDKHRQLEQNISWTPDLLKEMIELRLPSGVTVDELFEPGDMRGSTKPFDYLVRRTFLRPREVLQFLEECVAEAGDYETVILKDDIRAAEERFSGWKVSDLKQEYLKVFPYFDRLMECFRQEVHRYDSLSHLDALLRRKVPDLVDEFGSRALMETLFECSVIGVRLANAGSTRYKSEDLSLALPTSGSVYVHQSLHKGLNIRETRRAAASEPAGNPLDRLSVDLYSQMMASLPVQDLTFLGKSPTTIAVLEATDFAAYASSLGVQFVMDDSVNVARPNRISQERYVVNIVQFERLRSTMENLVIERGFTVDDYLVAEKRAQAASAPGTT